MNKGQLIYEISKRVELPKTTIATIVDIVFDTVKQGIITDGRVFTPIGIFTVKEAAPRRFMNVHTRQIEEIGPRKRIVFKPRFNIDEGTNG